MALIRPCADLRNKYSEISKICHETKEPMYITKNGTNDLVILSDEAFKEIEKNIKQSDEQRIERLISEKFDKHYEAFAEFQRDIIKKIEQAMKDVETGNYSTMEEFIAEMEEKYDIH